MKAPPFVQGINAFKMGKPITANPYPAGPPVEGDDYPGPHHNWLAGWKLWNAYHEMERDK